VRVLQVDSGREWRGGQSQVRLLCRELAREPDVDVRLVTRRGSELAKRVASERVTVSEVAWTIGLDPRALLGLVREVRRFEPDVIHTHDSHALALALVARRFAGSRRPKVVAYRLVDFPIRSGSNWFRADRVAAVSEAVKRVLVAAGLPAERITVIPPGVAPAEIRAAAATPFDVRGRLALPPDAPLAVNVGALVDQKDQRTLVRAADVARAARPDLHWMIAGEGELRPVLEAEIGRLDLAARVHLLGHVDRVPALIREADVFVLSSKAEGLPNAILEALALDKPVVATRAGGIVELLPPDCLVAVGDAAGLAAAVVRSLAHPRLVSLGDRYTAPALAGDFVALYRSLA
jgi:glycosyltransferase involved in cell wall biosynthesis